jgi:hypothetical protein
MIRTKERVDYEHDVMDIEHAVIKAIDELSKKVGHKFTYAQINSGLVNAMKSNFRHVANFEIKTIEGGDEEE